jgi:isoquinoline 1-oxidoreductase beta subunit
MLQRTPKGPGDPAPTRSPFASRRAFLVGAAATVGLGVGWLMWPRNWPEPQLGGEDEVMLNAWVRVAPSGEVTVALPQAEMGQGALSGLAQILAGEMGADWRLVAVEPSPFHPAYAQVGLVDEGTANLPPVLREIARAAGATAIRRFNLHLTGGSSSIRNYHQAMREAGAVARALLEGAAARAWGVSPDALDTRDGFVIYKANRMPFAEAMRTIDPDDAANARLRTAPDALVGRPLPRLDLPPKVDGTARFGADVRLPDMVFAAIRHGPAGNGRLVAAEAPAGVMLVKGDNWVAVTGATNHEAQRALGLVNARFATEGAAAGPAGEAQLQAALAGDGGKEVASFGDVAEAIGARAVSADYAVPFLAHACMEPMVATARITGDRVELWGPTQSRTLAVMGVARALEVDESKITVHPTLLGGGFGRKAEADHFIEAALIARTLGKPVQLQWSREEDFQADKVRPAGLARIRGSVDAAGRIAAFDVRIAIPSVMASFMARNLPALAPSPDSASATAIEGADSIPYATSAFRAVHVPVDQPVPLGFWRSVGHSFSAFFVESFMDELAAAARMDPVRFRLAHLAAAPRHAAVLKAVAADARWDSPSPQGVARGVALHESFGSIVATVVEAGVRDGAVIVPRVFVAIDCGRAINPDSVRAQLEGATIQGLDAALQGRLSFAEGMAEQRNFDSYPLLGLDRSPVVVSRIVESGGPLGGLGEPGLPPAAPALANALAAATGVRARRLPLGATYA